MLVKEFIDKLELALREPSKYQSGGWGKYDGQYWNWDCICLIKGILWGWKNDKTKPRGGGAVYASNGVPDIGENTMINLCKNVSTDFTNIKKGEMVWLDGHAGVYVGDSNVIEATAGWNTFKVIKSQIGKNGERTYNGKGGSANWQKHGFLPYVDYTEDEIVEPKDDAHIEEPKEEEPKFKVGDKVVPIKLVNWRGVALVQYDNEYTIMQIDKRGAVLGAPRNGKLQVWAVLKLDNIKKVG